MKSIGGASSSPVLQAGDRQINFLSPHQLDALVAAIRERETQVHVAPSDAVVEVNVEPPPIPVEVRNVIEPAEITNTHTSIIEFSAKHVYLAVLLHGFLMFALLGMGAYVSISKLDQYINPAGQPQSELSR